MKYYPSLRHTAIAAAALWTISAPAQSTRARILAPIDSTNRTAIVDSRSPRAIASNDIGSVAPDTKLEGISIVFRRSDAQQSDLEALIAAQQDSSSALYHQWLTPEQFAGRFGMADTDLTKVENWLQSQGFAVESVSRGHDRIQFSGTAAQVAVAFGSPLHLYKSNGITHFAPSADLSIPAALATSVLGIRNLSDFRPAPQARFMPVRPQFTSSQSGSHYLTPKDVSTIYDVNAAYSAGYNGANQSIAVVGQSSVLTTDITKFQTAAGVTVKAPTLVLVPGTGSALISTGDEAESDLDLEYTSGMAPGASIFFVYTGSNTNYGAFDALQYAISERVAPIVSVSYGECEAVLGASNYNTLNAVLAQAAAQGQTIVAAAGDEGSTACAGVTSLTAAQQQIVSALFPASSQYVTGMGGTEFPAAAIATTNSTYWTPASGSDVIGSALSYVPEQVWNDDSSSAGLSAGGGGMSTFTPRPSWQTGVPGIPSGTFRLVPDISLASSPNNVGYLYCSSDSTATGITGSCVNGFRDANTQYLTVAGGTSFAAPVFAGMLALINQARNSVGQGVVNPILYTLASVPATYATSFHDITSGTNACTAGTTYCSTAGAAVYAAGTGYDEASGIGSVDLYKLLSAWPTSSVSALKGTVTTVTPASTVPISGASDAVIITVVPSTSSTAVAPTGTVSVTVDGSVVNASVTLASGVAGYVFTSSTTGSHVISVTYSGDSTYAGSTATSIVTVGGTIGIFTVSAPALTVTNGSSASSTITVTPGNGYTGTVAWTLSTNSTINNACYTINNAVITGAAATSTLTISAGASQCTSAVLKLGTGQTAGRFGGQAVGNRVPPSPLSRIPSTFALAGLIGLGFMSRGRSKRIYGIATMVFLMGASFALIGCGDNSVSSSSSTTLATTGNFQITLTGTDTVNSSIQSSTTFILTIK